MTPLRLNLMPASTSADAAGLAEAAQIAAMVDRLASCGFAVAIDLLPAELVMLLRSEALALDKRAAMSDGGIGRQSDLAHDANIRQTRICWFDQAGAQQTEIGTTQTSQTATGSTATQSTEPQSTEAAPALPGQVAFAAFADRLRLAINQRLFLGLFEFEAQYAIYPAGGFYGRHLDSFEGARNRMVSLVAYLNPDWHESEGGLLRIWQPQSPETAPPDLVVMPNAGTVVLMLSEEIPHEVTPAVRERLSVAGWFSINQTANGRIDPAR